MSERCTPWVEAIAYAAAATGLRRLEPPYAVELTFYMPRPKRPKYDWPTKDGDLDKLVRAVLDGTKQGGLIVDDRHVTSITTRKEFGHPRVRVVIA